MRHPAGLLLEFRTGSKRVSWCTAEYLYSSLAHWGVRCNHPLGHISREKYIKRAVIFEASCIELPVGIMDLVEK